jgi:hypothetical protein
MELNADFTDGTDQRRFLFILQIGWSAFSVVKTTKQRESVLVKKRLNKPIGNTNVTTLNKSRG